MNATTAELTKFARVLWKPADLIEIRIIHGRTRNSRTLRFCNAGDIAQHADQMVRANAEGWNIYAGINPRRQKARGDANVLLARVLFADREHTDATGATAAIEAVGLPTPSMTINSGHGIHSYWKLDQPIEPAAWREFQRDLAAVLGTDGKVHNEERVTRLPGFANVKTPLPAPCGIIECDPVRVYDLGTLNIPMRPGSDTPPPVFTVRRHRERGVGGADLFERCRAYLRKCPNAISGNRGHDATFYAANTCNRFGLSIDEAIDLMRWFSVEKCDPPWLDKEIQHKVQSAYARNASQHGQKLAEDRQRQQPRRAVFTLKTKPGDSSVSRFTLDCTLVGENGRASINATVIDTLNNHRCDSVEVTRGNARDAAVKLAGMMPGAEANIVEAELRAALDGNSIDDLRPVPLGEIWRTSPTPREPVIDGLLRRGQVGNLISTSKSYKTYLVMGLSIAFVMRRQWLERFPCVGGRVLIIDMELQAPDITFRTRDIGRAMYADEDQLTTAIEVVSLRGRVGTINEIERLLLTKSSGEYDLVVIDPFYKCYPDPFDENSNAQMTNLYRRFERLAEHLDAGVMIVHHGTKGSQAEKRTVDVGAGASAQSRSADCHIALREHEQPDAVVLDARVRSFPPIEPFVLRWKYPLWHRDHTLNPEDLKTGRKSRNIGSGEPAPPKEKPEPWTAERFVKTLLTDKPIEKKLVVALAREAGVAVNQIESLLALALHKTIAFEWSAQGSNKPLFASIEQPVTRISSKGKSDKGLQKKDGGNE